MKKMHNVKKIRGRDGTPIEVVTRGGRFNRPAFPSRDPLDPQKGDERKAMRDMFASLDSLDQRREGK